MPQLAKSPLTRRGFASGALMTTVCVSLAPASLAAEADKISGKQGLITDYGAVADNATVNTKSIQSAIDDMATKGGGTVIVPQGVFVSGALFFKPKVHLHLMAGAVLKCSTDLSHFPVQRTRIEGHFAPAFNPALINADGCHGLKITGQGTLDGDGRQIWDRFWQLRNAAPDPGNFPNLGVPRARLALIENSRNVTVDGITFKDSQFWNLHLYKCRGVRVRNARFEVPDDYKQAPSTDGIDLDSCQNVTIEGCYFSVTDDCIAAKGTKGPNALKDKDSPPVEHVRVRNCTFRRGHGVFTCGSEATLVRDVIVENCRIVGGINILVLKLRPDTPQTYEDITLRNISLEAEGGTIISVRPWTQYFNLKGETPPQSRVRRVTLSGFKGRYGSFGSIRPNPGQTTISDITLKNIDLQLQRPELEAVGVANLRADNVVVNGAAMKF
ncbi:MAG: glycosyl hydrolase family 28 protein [Asticcacaulis sp.]